MWPARRCGCCATRPRRRPCAPIWRKPAAGSGRRGRWNAPPRPSPPFWRSPGRSASSLATLPDPLLSYIGSVNWRSPRNLTLMLLLCRPFRLSGLALFPVLLLSLILPAAALAQDVSKDNFLAERYDVAATIEPASQSLSAVAKVDFKARDASSIVRVELHPNLNVAEIKNAAGKAVNFDRDQLNPLLLTINLPSAVTAGSTVSLTFTYTGPLSNEENSPVPGVRLA